MRATLVTIPLSHYCEKARWALERCGVPFREEGHVPFASRLATLRHGRWGSVPMLLPYSPGGLERVTDSTAILHWADARALGERRLYPTQAGPRAEVEALEELFDTRLGPHTRRIAYHHVLKDPPLLLEIVTRGVPRAEQLAVRVLLPALVVAVRRGLRIDASGVGRSRTRIDDVFVEVERRLEDGRPFLAGERFSAADLTFAALAAPMLFPATYAGPLPRLDQLREEARLEVERLRAMPAGVFALRMYEQHRES